jgi:hypothetical protein
MTMRMLHGIGFGMVLDSYKGAHRGPVTRQDAIVCHARSRRHRICPNVRHIRVSPRAKVSLCCARHTAAVGEALRHTGIVLAAGAVFHSFPSSFI